VGKLGQTGTHGFRASACVKEREREKMLLSRSDLALSNAFSILSFRARRSAVEEALAISFLRIIRDVSTVLDMTGSRRHEQVLRKPDGVC
jgi:hypothetical protein